MLISLAKDGDFISCEESQVTAFESQGYQRSDSPGKPSQNQPVSVAQPVPSGLVRLFKGDLEITAEPLQVASFEAQGWSRSSAGGSADAGQQQANAGSGETVKSPVDPAEQLKALLVMLDPNADDDWTADKLIKLATLKEIIGHEVTRAEVNEVWPGFNRDVLRAHQAQSQPQ